MKVVHTYIDKHDLIWKELLYVQYLSLILAKKHYGNISFYGDENACEQMREMGLPYDTLNDDITKKSDMDTWSIPKLKVYESISEPFLHIDTDTLIFDKIDFGTYQQDFLFSHIDMALPNGYKKDEIMEELYKYYFCRIPKGQDRDDNYPFKTMVSETVNQLPESTLTDIDTKEDFVYMDKTYSKLFFDLMEKIDKKVFDSTHFPSIPNMNIVYIKDTKTFKKVCQETLKHYEENKSRIDKEEYGPCYIEQLMLHVHLRMLNSQYKKSNKKDDHVIFEHNPMMQIDPENNNADYTKISYPFRLSILNQKHFKCDCCDKSTITKLSKFKDFKKESDSDKFKKIIIKDADDVKNYFDENFNGFLHTSYTKWYDIIQAIIIDKLRNEIGDDGIRNIHRYYESKYSDLDLPLVSGGEKLYTELTGFDFKSKTGLI